MSLTKAGKAWGTLSNTPYIFDAVWTPRSKGKSSGTLYEVKPVQLAAGLLNGLRERHDLQTSMVEDVILGCVSPVGEQGSNIAKAAAMFAGWAPSIAGVQLDSLLRIGSRGGQLRGGQGRHGLAAPGRGRRYRMYVSNGGAMFSDPEFVLGQKSGPQGIDADL